MKKNLVRIIPEKTDRKLVAHHGDTPANFSFSKTSRNILVLIFVFFMISALSFLLAKNLKESQAYDISKFSAGNIISDYTMSNTETMNEQQIQEFLTSKNACNDRNIQRAANFPGYQYHIENGKFVCLSEETFEYNGEKQTAARVIYQASRDFQINPQVLITLIEKEQSLVTDTWPNHIQYRSATGFGCPDTAACDAKYYGFRNQVRNAAKLFRDVLDGGYTNYPVGENFIYYNPNFSCGGSKVYVENLATSALYRYTPYQPNAEALKNYPGTSYCGAYGNRNFYMLFSRWFGDPTVSKQVIKFKTIARPDATANQQGIIQDGKYFLSTGLDPNFYLDVQYANKNEHALVQMYSQWSKENQAQQWQFTHLGNNIYTIKSVLSNKNLSYSFDDILNKPQLKLTTENLDDCSNRWKAVKNQNQYTFYSSCDEARSLAVRGQSVTYATPVEVNLSSNPTLQSEHWQLTPASTPAPIKPLIEDGNYYIKTSLNPNFYLDVAFSSPADFAKVQLYSQWSKENKAQIWNIKHLGNNKYQIKSSLSGKLLSFNLNNVSNNEPVFLLSERNNNCSQIWQAEQVDGGFFFHTTCDEKKALDVNGALAYYGTQIQIWDKWSNTNKAQIWSLEKITSKIESVPEPTPAPASTPAPIKPLIEDGNYYIKTSLNPNFYLDVAFSSPADFAKVQLYSQWSKENKAQIWNIKHLGNNKYQIKSSLSGKLLSFNLNNVSNNEPVFLLSERNNNCSQIWQAEQVDGGFFFHTTCDEKKALDVNGALAYYGTQIQIWDKWSNTNKAQIWSLEKTFL